MRLKHEARIFADLLDALIFFMAARVEPHSGADDGNLNLAITCMTCCLFIKFMTKTITTTLAPEKSVTADSSLEPDMQTVTTCVRWLSAKANHKRKSPGGLNPSGLAASINAHAAGFRMTGMNRPSSGESK